MNFRTNEELEEFLGDLEMKIDDLISEHQVRAMNTNHEEREKELAIVAALEQFKKEVI